MPNLEFSQDQKDYLNSLKQRAGFESLRPKIDLLLDDDNLDLAGKLDAVEKLDHVFISQRAIGSNNLAGWVVSLWQNISWGADYHDKFYPILTLVQRTASTLDRKTDLSNEAGPIVSLVEQVVPPTSEEMTSLADDSATASQSIDSSAEEKASPSVFTLGIPSIKVAGGFQKKPTILNGSVFYKVSVTNLFLDTFNQKKYPLMLTYQQASEFVEKTDDTIALVVNQNQEDLNSSIILGGVEAKAFSLDMIKQATEQDNTLTERTDVLDETNYPFELSIDRRNQLTLLYRNGEVASLITYTTPQETVTFLRDNLGLNSQSSTIKMTADGLRNFMKLQGVTPKNLADSVKSTVICYVPNQAVSNDLVRMHLERGVSSAPSIQSFIARHLIAMPSLPRSRTEFSSTMIDSARAFNRHIQPQRSWLVSPQSIFTQETPSALNQLKELTTSVTTLDSGLAQKGLKKVFNEIFSGSEQSKGSKKESSDLNYAFIKKDSRVYFVGRRDYLAYAFELNMPYFLLKENSPVFMSKRDVRKLLVEHDLKVKDLTDVVEQAIVCESKPKSTLNQLAEVLVLTIKQSDLSIENGKTHSNSSILSVLQGSSLAEESQKQGSFVREGVKVLSLSEAKDSAQQLLSQVFSNVQRQSENSSSFNYALVKKDGELYFIGQKLDSLYIFKLNMEYAALQEGQPIFMTPQNVRKFMSAMNLTKEDIVSLVDQAVVCAIEPGVELQQFVDAVIVTPDQDAVSFLTDNRVEMLPIVAVSDASQFVENIMSMSLENDAEQGIENSIKLELLTDHLDAMKQQIENLGPNPTSVDEGVSEIVEPYIRNLYPLLDNVEKIATAAAQDIKDVISDLPDNKKLLSEQEVKKSLTVCKNFYESIKPYLNAASESIKNFFLAVGRIIVRIIKALGEVLSYLGRTAKPVDAVFDSLPKTPEMAKAKKMTKTASHLATQAGNLLNGASKWMGNALKEEKKGDEPTSSAQELKQQEEPKKTEGRISGRKRPRDFP